MFLYRFLSTPICYQVKGIIEKVDTRQYLQYKKRKGKVTLRRMTESLITRELSRKSRANSVSPSVSSLRPEENGQRAHSKELSLSVLNQSSEVSEKCLQT